MKYAILFTLLVLGMAGQVLAQTPSGVSSTANLSDLRAPTAPGFILLGKAPAQVDRPSTPQGVATTLLGGLQGQDFALSASPYWLSQHPNLTFDEYTSTNAKIDFRCFYRDADFSLAVVTDSLKNRNAGFGIRTNLLRVRSPLARKSADKIQQALIDFAASPTTPGLRDTIAKYRPLVERDVVNFENKPLLLVSLAGSYAYRLPEGNREGDRRQGGAWVDVAWRPAPRIEVIGVARWQNLVSGALLDRHTNAWDYGIRFGGEFSLGSTRDWLFSGEFVQRFAGSKDSYRLAIVNEVEVTDNIYFTATFGEDFAAGHHTISLFGLNFGLTTDSRLKAP